MSKGTEVMFAPLPIQLACPVPITPEGETMRNGEAIPMEERTECCAVWAHWMIGGQVSCDIHTLQACEILDIDFDDIVAEVGRSPQEARVPWSERKRATQEEARSTQRSMESI